MASEFRLVRRVEFAETDLAGIMHFSNFFRYMEAAEHAFFRSLGLSIQMEIDGEVIGWPRVQVECSYKRPLRFEDEVEVLLKLHEQRQRWLLYRFEFRRIETGTPASEISAEGHMKVVCASLDRAAGRLKAISIPPAIAGLLEPAAEQAER